MRVTKNTLVKNYLYRAERTGAEIHPPPTLSRVSFLDGRGLIMTNRSYRKVASWAPAT